MAKFLSGKKKAGLTQRGEFWRGSMTLRASVGHYCFVICWTRPVCSKIIMPTVHLLDYVAGNIRSLVNAINQVGYEVEWIKSPDDVKNADVGDNETRSPAHCLWTATDCHMSRN